MKAIPTMRQFGTRGIVVSSGLVAAVFSVGSTRIAPVPTIAKISGSQHAMFGGTVSRSMVNLTDKNVPDRFDPEGRNLLWKVPLGSRSYGDPIISGGKIFVGTNNESDIVRNARDTIVNKAGEVEPIICFQEPNLTRPFAPHLLLPMAFFM